MADVDMRGKTHALVESTNGADRTIQLNDQKSYRLVHTNKDTSDGDALGKVIFTTSLTQDVAAVTATMAAGTNKGVILASGFAYVGPGVHLVAHESMTGSPVIFVEETPHYLGRF